MELEQQRGFEKTGDRLALITVVGSALLVLGGMGVLFGAAGGVRMPGQGALSVWNPGLVSKWLADVSTAIGESPLFSAGSHLGTGSTAPDLTTVLVIVVFLAWAGWGEVKQFRKLMKTRRK